jgi:hypothetical protein
MEVHMKSKAISLVLPLFLATVVVGFFEPQQLGTWKLNEAKSKIPAGAPKTMTVTYEAAGDMIKVTVDGVDATGQSTHNEWTGKFDGKDYPVTGDPNADVRSYKVINKRTLDFWNKKDGKPTLTGRLVLLADGKSRTATTTATTPDGKKMKTTAIYDKQ